MPRIKIDALGSELAKLMAEYASDVTEEMKAEAKEVAKEAVRELKTSSPEGTGKGRKGHYKDGWASKTEAENATSIGIRVYNRKTVSYTHLTLPTILRV